MASKTGDLIGGLLNATLGNLTELLIALAALRAGQYVLVKASIVGAIITNTLFMLGASLLLGGFTHHAREYNRNTARLQAGLLFLATIAMLIPSVLAEADGATNAAFTQSLSVGLSILLILTCAMGLLFSLKTHRELFASEDRSKSDEKEWPLSLALGTLAAVTVLVALVSEVLSNRCSRQQRRSESPPPLSASSSLLWSVERRNGFGAFRGTQEQFGPERWHRAGERGADRAVCCSGTRAFQLSARSHADGPAFLAGCGGDDADRQRDGVSGYQHRAVGLVCRSLDSDHLRHFRHDALSAAAPDPMNYADRCEFAREKNVAAPIDCSRSV